MPAWKTLKLFLALSCDESTRLVSESLDHPLPASERFAIRLHAMICRSCRRYARQIRLLRETMIRHDQALLASGADPSMPEQSTPGVSGEALSPQARARIQDVLSRHE
ncbi:MAG: zf-HC2 domain-containing protein [Planctomycetota bacterium]